MTPIRPLKGLSRNIVTMTGGLANSDNLVSGERKVTIQIAVFTTKFGLSIANSLAQLGNRRWILSFECSRMERKLAIGQRREQYTVYHIHTVSIKHSYIAKHNLSLTAEEEKCPIRRKKNKDNHVKPLSPECSNIVFFNFRRWHGDGVWK